jgi:hypothetical protein
MTVLAGIAALAMAAGVGYYVGQRVRSTPPTWKKRTSRTALGKLALSLLVVLAVRRIRQSSPVERMLPDAVHLWAVRLIAPLAVLRASRGRY